MVSTIFNKKSGKITAICLLVICITILHYGTDHLKVSSHIVFRELYLLPISLAGYWFGIYGGILTSISITFLYLPFVLSFSQDLNGHYFGDITQIVIFNIFGLFFGYLHDREKKHRRKLLEAENLAAIGKAVSYIAHDMKTPITAAGGLVLQVRRKIENSKLIHKLDLASEQIHRLEVLVSDMLAFAKPLKLDLQKGMIDQLVEEIETITSEKAAQYAVTLRTDLPEDIPSVEYDKYRLLEALVNLVNNAIEASPRGSEVVLRCQYLETCITIEISDQGCGIPKDIFSDIFTPFVTTKKEGTGLGLPIVKKIIDAHDGSIDVVANNESGVTFIITIPL